MSRLFASCVLLALFASSAISQETAEEDNPVPQLLENLESEQVNVSASAARSLGVIFTPGGKEYPQELEEVTGKLIEKLESPVGAKLREESARALGRMKSTAALEKIKTAIDDPDIQVALAAAEAAANILPVDEARTFLKERGEDESQQVKAAVYQALAGIAKAEDADFLAQGLMIDNWRVQEGAVRGLERAVHAGANLTPATYDQVADVLGAEILNAANTAIHFFIHVRNEESFRALLTAVDKRGDGSKEDETWRCRAMGLRAVRHLGWPSNRDALPAVMRQLGDPISNVSYEARNLLTHLRKEHFVSQEDLFPLLLTELEKSQSLPQQAGIMREMGAHVDRQYASRVAQAASKILLKAVEAKEEWSARAFAVQLVGASGYTGVMENIAGCVSDDVSNVRQAAGGALAELAPLVKPEQAEAVAEILQPLLVDPVDWRKTAIAARAAGYYPADEAIKPLTLLLSHSVLNVKSAASESLAQMAAESGTDQKGLIKQEVFDELSSNSAAWEYGAKVLGALNDAQAVSLLIVILQKGNWRAQENAARAAQAIAKNHQLNSKELSDTLVEVAQSEVLQVQDAANGALRTIKGK